MMIEKGKITPEKFYRAVLNLNTVDECRAFFEDVCTMQEIKLIAQRLDVAIALSEGKSYIEANRITGASTATICRVNKALHYGEGGYRTVIERLKETDD